MYFRPAFTIIVTTIIVTTLLVADAFTFAPAYATFDCVRAIDPFIATMAISASAQRVIPNPIDQNPWAIGAVRWT